MILRIFFISLLFFNMLFISCKKKEEVTGDDIPVNVNSYTNSAIYQKGNIVMYNSKVYQATTAVKKIPPSTFNLATRNEVFNPWIVSSIAYAKTALDASFETVKIWSGKEIYTVDDIVLAGDGKYYRAMLYNVDKNPIHNQNSDTNLDGAWREIPDKDAIAMNIIKGHNAKLSDVSMLTAINVNASNSVAETLPVEGSVGLQKSLINGDKPTVSLNESVVLAYRWSYDTAYVENSVATYGQKYYRAKWWNKGDVPRNAIFTNELLDTPWQEITSDLFRQMYKDNVVKGKQPPAGDVIYVDDTDKHTSSKTGYIKKWAWASITDSSVKPLPDVDDASFESIYMARVKKAFSDSALAGNILTEDSAIATTLIGSVLNADKWNTIFPNRNDAYYSYVNFTSAINLLGKYAYLVLTHTSGNLSYQKIFVLHKPTAVIRLISQSDYFHNGGVAANGYEAKYKVLNFAKFLNETENNDKLRILAAFLAHCSYQSSSYWQRSSNEKTFDSTKFNGITFDETFTNKYYIGNQTTTNKLNNIIAFSMVKNGDTKYEGSTYGNFVNYSREFPAVRDKSYHGRGPYLIKGSDNYALLSGIIFGRTDILLNNPDILQNGSTVITDSFNNTALSGGSLGFLTGLISFMMNNNNLTYSVNDVLVLNDANGVYDESKVKIKKNSDKGQSGFGWTVNIINGSEEANKDYRSERANNYNPALGSRVLHYTFFGHLFKAKIDATEKLDTLGYTAY